MVGLGVVRMCLEFFGPHPDGMQLTHGPAPDR
jgi:hypothetical protein